MLARVPPPPSSLTPFLWQSKQRRGNDGIERYVLREVDNHAQGFLKFRNVAGSFISLLVSLGEWSDLGAIHCGQEED